MLPDGRRADRLVSGQLRQEDVVGRRAFGIAGRKQTGLMII